MCQWYNLGFIVGGEVSGTAYRKKACFERALHHKAEFADAWSNLGFTGDKRGVFDVYFLGPRDHQGPS